MPDKPAAPLYSWAVSHSNGMTAFTMEAAYSVIEDTGHMVLKGADHNPVFTAEPGLGCTFERRGRAETPTVAVEIHGAPVLGDEDKERLAGAIGESVRRGRVR